MPCGPPPIPASRPARRPHYKARLARDPNELGGLDSNAVGSLCRRLVENGPLMFHMLPWKNGRLITR